MAVAPKCAFLVPGMDKGRKPVPLRGDGRVSPLLPASPLRSTVLLPALHPGGHCLHLGGSGGCQVLCKWCHCKPINLGVF